MSTWNNTVDDGSVLEDSHALTKLHSIHYASARLLVKPLTDEHRDFYCALMTNRQVLQHIHPVLSAQSALHSFQSTLSSNQRCHPIRFVFVVCMRQSGIPIGIAAINHLNLVKGLANIGRILQPQWCGKGLGTELSVAIIRLLAKEFGIHCFVKDIAANNHAAIYSAKNIGFTKISGKSNETIHAIEQYQFVFNENFLTLK